MTFDLPIAPLIEACLAALVGWLFKRLDALHRRFDSIEVKCADNASRHDVLDARFGDRMAEFERFRNTLDGIDTKMDRMLETINRDHVPRPEIDARFEALKQKH